MIAVIDYGMGNLDSVCKALTFCGGKHELIDRPEDLARFDGALLPGGYVRVVLAERFDMPRLAVPVGALVFEGGEKHVYVLDAEDRAILRAVGDGPQAGDLQVLGDVFAADDRIVTGGIHKVRPGGRVVPVER